MSLIADYDTPSCFNYFYANLNTTSKLHRTLVWYKYLLEIFVFLLINVSTTNQNKARGYLMCVAHWYTVFRKRAINSICSQYVCNGVFETTVHWTKVVVRKARKVMFNLCDVIQFIIDGLYNRPLPKKLFVRHAIWALYNYNKFH